MHLFLTKDDEPVTALDDLALMPGLKQLYIDVQPGCEEQMVLDYGYLENMVELAIGGNPGDPLQVLRKRGADVAAASDEDREAWKDELEKAFAVYKDVLGWEMPEYCYRIEIDGIPYFLHLSQVDAMVYEFYTYGYDYDKNAMVRVDFFKVDALTGAMDAYLDI